MKSVLKYAIHIGVTELRLPIGSELLSVAPQNSGIRLWALVPDDGAGLQIRNIVVCNTGDLMEYNNLKFIGTVLFEEGRFVYHAFEVL